MSLDEARLALERGDFARARKLARERLGDESDAKEAQALLDRTKPDPLIVWLSAACVVFFVVVVFLTLRHAP